MQARPLILIVCLLLLCFGAEMLGGMARRANSHGAAHWIETNKAYVAESGSHCCGVGDCRREGATKFREAPEGVYVAVGAGDEVLMPRRLIGRGLYPSIDDDWWICIRDGVVRCIFKPTTGG